MLKKYSAVFLAPIACAAILLISFLLGGLYPFGEGLVSWCDMNQQVIPLINTFKDIFSSGTGLFQNFNHAGGMNFYGVFFFFVSSPFNLLTLFVDKADIPQFMNILVVLKLSIAGASAAFFFCKRRPDGSIILKTLLGVLYGLCGYGLMFYQNIIWLDILILFPLLYLACYELLEKGRSLFLILILSVCVIINYYISFMLYLFVILFFGIKALFKKVQRDVWFKLGISAVISLLISAVVWLPSLLQYTSSARQGSVIESLQSASFFTSYETTLPIILCSAFTMSIILYTLFSGGAKKQADKFTLLFLMLLPLIIEPINLMWHTGSYMAFPARYAFITIFLSLELSSDITISTEGVRNSNRFLSLLSICLSALTAVFLVWYTYYNFNSLTSYTSTLWGDSESFDGIACAFLAALAVYVVIYLLLRHRHISKKIFSVSAAILIVCESFCSVGIYMLSAKGSFNYENYKNVLSVAESHTDDSFHRVSMYQKYTDANLLGAVGFNTLAHYTSLNDATFMEAAKQMGYSGYWMEINSAGGSILSDALLGIKYTLQTNAEEDYYLSQNKVFPSVIFSDNAFETELSGERITSIDNAIAGITGVTVSEKYLPDNTLGFSTNDFGYEFNKGATLVYNITVGQPRAIYLDCYNGFSNALVEPINGAFDVHVNGQYVVTNFPRQHFNGLLFLGEYKNTSLQITLKINKDFLASSFGVFGIDTQGFDSAINNVRGTEMTLENGKLFAVIPEDSPKNVFLPIPYKEGLKITVGGTKVAVKKALSGFVSFDTLGLSGELCVSYTPKGFWLGAVLSGFGILAFLAALILFRRKLPPILERIAGILFASVFTVFCAAVYILPLLINMLS